MRPLHVNDPMPKSFSSIHLTFITWPREGSPGKHSSTWGIGLPNRTLDNPPISKFGKLHKVFEHMFNLKGGIRCACLGGSCIKIDLLGMIHMTCGPLEGVPCLSLQDLAR
jgi:hypothetical protein